MTSTARPVVQPNLFLSDGLPLPAPTDAVNPSGDDHRRRPGLQVDARPAVQRRRGEGVRSGNVFSAGYIGSRATRVAFVIPNLDLAPAAPGSIQPRRTYAAQLPNVTTIGMFASDFECDLRCLAARVSTPSPQRSHCQLKLHACAHGLDVANAERRQRHRALRCRFRCPPPNRVFGQLRTAIRAIVHGRHENGSCRVAGQRRCVVANRLAVHGDQCGHPKQHQRGQRSAQRGRRRDARRSQHRPMVQRRSVFGAADQHHRQRRPQHPSRPAATRSGRLVFQRLCAVGDVKLQIRVEFYNITNTPNFANPIAQLGAPGFGTINSTGNSAPRQIQFAAKYLF